MKNSDLIYPKVCYPIDRSYRVAHVYPLARKISSCENFPFNALMQDLSYRYAFACNKKCLPQLEHFKYRDRK